MTAKTETLTQQCARLQLSFMRDHHAAILQEGARQQWTPETILARLLAGEIQLRADRALERRLQAARFPLAKSIADFDWTWPSKINRAQIQQLFHLDWVPQHGNVFLLGPVGVGKTHLALALGRQACHMGFTVRWITAIQLVNTLQAAQNAQRLAAELKTFLKPQLLCLDELGYMPIDKTGADLLFQVISERYERGSLCITSNKPFKQWAGIFNNDATLASAILDRLLHHGEPVLIAGKSYRMKDKDSGGDA